jgi:hypothetical protein
MSRKKHRKPNPLKNKKTVFEQLFSGVHPAAAAAPRPAAPPAPYRVELPLFNTWVKQWQDNLRTAAGLPTEPVIVASFEVVS